MPRLSCGLVALVCAAGVVALTAQGPSVSVVNDLVHLRAPDLHFLEGRALTQLRDGRAARFDMSVELASRRGGPAIARASQEFNVSFDLWEERFAVTRVGQPPRSVSHLSAAAAEAWCLDNVTIPLASISAGDRPAIWVRITLQHKDEPASQSDEPSLSLRRLVDALSRRGESGDAPRLVQAGPFRLTN